MSARSVPLAEAKAEARALGDECKAHPKSCPECAPREPCGQIIAMRADLARRRRDIRTWFDPAPDSPTLFD